VRQFFLAAILLKLHLSAQVLLTRHEALRIYFPEPASIERKNLFLTDVQIDKIQVQAKAKVESKIVTYYVGRLDDHVQGYAFFDTRTIRTEPATYMVVINPDSSLRAVELLAFYEPEDYLPPKKWLSLFEKKTLSDDLWLKRGIHSISGATLSAQAITEGVRRTLAIFQIAVAKDGRP